MKTAFYLKGIDILVQAIAILLPFFIGIAAGELPFYLLTAFFLIGMAQAVSAMLNRLLLDRFLWSGWRRLYNICLCTLAVCVPVFNILHLPNGTGLVIAFYGCCTLMAITYGCISFAEARYLFRIIRRQQYTRI